MYRKSRLNKKAIQQSRIKKKTRGVKVNSYALFDEEDIIESDVAKSITSALWSDNVSTLGTVYTSSAQTSSVSGQYQWEVYAENPQTNASASVQYNIAWGHYAGSGSITGSGASTQDKSPSKAVYTAFANQLLANGVDKFTNNSVSVDQAYFICVNRNRFKEKMNPNGWQLDLWLGGTDETKLIDDSRYNAASSVNGNRVYNVISGSLATGQSTTTDNFGLFYPDLGILMLDQHKIDTVNGTLGDPIADNLCAAGTHTDQLSAFFNAANKATYGRNFQGRAEEDISSTHYFVRCKNSEYNFTNNPTFSTAVGNIHNASMVGDPTTYITTVGLYNDENELVATAKLSKPLAKNFSREATIRVKLDY